MQDANSLPWTEASASAETVALGAPEHRVWTAPVQPAAALAAEMGGAEIAIEAYANHGRWIAECPDCHGAQLACPDDPRFMCNNCANIVVGGLWRPVTWPQERAEIEELLEVRPVTAQSWTPEVSLEDLATENEMQGV